MIERGAQESQIRERFKDAALLALKMEEGDHEPKNISRLFKPEKSRKHSPLEPLEGMQPYYTLILAQ